MANAPLHALSYQSPPPPQPYYSPITIQSPTDEPYILPQHYTTHPRGTGDNGRYSQIFGQLMNARSSINLAQSHLQCQLPYGYVHLILLVIHATCLANSIFSGIQLGHVLQARHAPRVCDVSKRY